MVSLWQRLFPRKPKSNGAKKKPNNKARAKNTGWNRFVKDDVRLNRTGKPYKPNAYLPQNKARALVELNKAIAFASRANNITRQRVEFLRKKGAGAAANAMARNMQRDQRDALYALKQQKVALEGSNRWLAYPLYVSSKPGRPIGVRKDWRTVSNRYDDDYKHLLTLAKPTRSNAPQYAPMKSKPTRR